MSKVDYRNKVLPRLSQCRLHPPYMQSLIHQANCNEYNYLIQEIRLK